ncbi:hypothetical protein Tco_0214452 [Tanacetum coccineum]
MTLDIHNWSSTDHQEIHKIVKDEILPIVNQVDARFQNFEIQFLKEAAKFVRDFKSVAKETDESLAKHKALEFEIERLLRVVVSVKILCLLCKILLLLKHPISRLSLTVRKNNLKIVSLKRKMNMLNFGMIEKIERLQAQLGDLKGKSKDTPCLLDTLDPLSQKLENENVELEFQNRKHGKTRRPQPRSNTKNDRVPSASKSNCIKNKDVEVEEHHRNLLLSKNKKHMSFECNNVKLAIQNDKSDVVCAMCKQCLITANHDVCVLNYVNDMNSRDDKHSANVSKIANQKKHKPQVKKPKKAGSKERLASPKPSKPRSCFRWSPT